MCSRLSAVALPARAYELYPRGILSTHPLYEASEEYGRLVAARKKAGAEGARWSALLKRIDSRLPECRTQNQSLHLPTGSMDAAYAAWLRLPEAMIMPGERYRTLWMPPEIGQFIIPDVDAKRDLTRTSTLYDCFFTNDW